MKSTRIVYVLKSWLMISLIILAVSATSAVQAGDYIPLKVIHTDPGNGATDVFTNVMVKAYLSKKANQETINVFSVTLSDGASEIGGQVEYDAFENEISFIPATPLIENTTYYAVVSTAVEDLENKPLAKRKEWVFTTRGKDVIRPVITYASPSPDSELVPRSTVINIVFSEPIIEETLTTGTVMLSTDLEEIEGELDYDNSTRTLTFRPSRELEYETRYQVNVMDWIKDLNGNSLPAKAEWSFVSELPPDTEPPSIVDVYPEAKKREVSVTTEVVVHFSEIVLSADLSIFSFSLRDGDKTVPGRLDYDYKKKEARFIPDGMLQYGRLYTAEIKKGIRDLAGNRLDENYRWSFATIPPPDVEPPMVIKTFPMDGDRDISVIVGLKTFFTENLDMATLNEANVQLYLEENTIPGKVDFDEETKTLSFNPIRPLKHGTKYLFMLRRGVTDLNGNPLREEIGTIFQTEPPPDVYPPKVVAAYPAVGAVNVPLDTDISIVFDEEIQKTTLNLFTFTVSEMKINTYGDMTYLRGEKKGTFKPKELLSYDTLYQVKIFNIKDLAGNRMSDVFTWSFMTLPAPDTTPPAVDITSPEDGTEGVPVNFPVNVRFTEPVKPESVNEFTFLLSDGLNNIAGMVSYNQDAKTATFEHKDPLIPGKIYWAHLSHLIQDLVGNELGEDYVWKFTTVPPPDLEPPHIIRY
ncbi:MAG: Ig-like domain-containing protein, partial [bacterium]|nr:Ig-like domain-containing protein [bacterium]